MRRAVVDNIVSMFLEIERLAGSEEAERWIDEIESDLPVKETRELERRLAKLEEDGG